MGPPASPSPFLSPLSSPPKAPHSFPHDEKASNASPPASSAQPPSPERQCACPCGPFEVALKAAVVLMTFRRYPLPTLDISPYPRDTVTGERIPVRNLHKYSEAHLWPDGIHCFCSLRPGGEERSVCLVVPSQGSMPGSPCLRCSDWTPNGAGGCPYFVDLKQLFDRSDAMFGMEILPLYNFPLRTSEHTGNLLASNDAHPHPPVAFPSSVAAHPLVEPSSPGAQLTPPPTFGVKPGAVTDPKRIWSPPPPRDVFGRVEDMSLPAATEVQEVFDEMFNGAGISYRRLMAVIGRCTVCDHVMVLPNIPTHPCIGCGNDTGPCPSRNPLLPEDRRTLPAAGSGIKESEAGQVTIEADDDDIEIVDDVNGAPMRKRKIGFNTPPSLRIFVSAMKKACITNDSGPSQMMPVLAKTEEVETTDLSGIPVRIPTPENSREVYRDENEEFIMYEQA